MTTSTDKSLLALLASAALVITMAASSPAFAMANNGLNGADKTKDDLEKDGWTCVVVATGFWECTKPGEPKQWCDTHSCGPAPMKGGTKPKLPGTVLRNGTVLMHG
jgi:hypothetical protein